MENLVGQGLIDLTVTAALFSFRLTAEFVCGVLFLLVACGVQILEEEVELNMKEAAVISMGTEVSEHDMTNIKALCDQVSPLVAVLLLLLYSLNTKELFAVKNMHGLQPQLAKIAQKCGTTN